MSIIRELPTVDSGFSKALVNPISEIKQEDIKQLAVYYFRLKKFYNDERSVINQHSLGWKMGVYKEIRDLEHFFNILGYENDKITNLR